MKNIKMSNIGEDIQIALKSPYPPIIPINRLGLTKYEGNLYGDWLGALWLLAEFKFPTTFKKVREIDLFKALLNPLPHREEWKFPKKPEYSYVFEPIYNDNRWFEDKDMMNLGQLKTKDYLLNDIRTKAHSIFSICSLMYNISYGVWEQDTKNSTNPISYVGLFLAINNIGYENKSYGRLLAEQEIKNARN